MKSLRIGVLGGIGPEATGIFYLKLIRRLQEKGLIKKNSDFPQIFINSIPAPELIFDGVEKTDLSVYIKGLRELDGQNLNFIVMVCNTIHLYHQELQAKITTELIDLRKEVYKKLRNLKIKKLVVVGTPSTISLGLYKFEDISYLKLSKLEIEELSEAIFNFNKGKDKEEQKEKVEKIATQCIAQGAEAVLLGCTEFAVMLEQAELPKIDTIDILVDYVVGRYIRED